MEFSVGHANHGSMSWNPKTRGGRHESDSQRERPAAFCQWQVTTEAINMSICDKIYESHKNELILFTEDFTKDITTHNKTTTSYYIYFLLLFIP